MKKIMFVLLVISFCNIFFASELIVKSELKDVKVFLRGAELNHSAVFDYSKGTNRIIISGLADNVDENSLNIKGKGNFMILESRLSRNYLVEKEKSEAIKMLEDSLDLLQNEIDLLNSDIQVSQSQIDLIQSNKNLGTETKAPSVTEIKNMQEFFKRELTSLNKDIIKSNTAIKNKNERREKIKVQLEEMRGNFTKSSSEIIVSILSEGKGKGELEIKYFTHSAGWKAAYDIRTESIKSPIQLSQKALIWQKTGVDWKDMSIALSTGNPSISSSIPNLYTWNLDFYPEPVLSKRDKTFDTAAGAEQHSINQQLSSHTIRNIVSSEVIEVFTSQLAHEFVTPVKYTIPSDGKENMVLLKDYQIEASYSYYAAPKLDQQVYLMAKVKDWGNNPIIPGSANIFFENTYVGNTYLSLNDTEEEIKISLGRDPNVSVKREEVKDFSEDKFLSSDIERKFAYKLMVKNNKNTAIDFILEDQIPISNQEDIEVEILNIDNAKTDKDTGKLTWQFKLDQNSSTERNLSFSVRYPGQKRIQGL